MTSSTLEITPRSTNRGAVSNAEHAAGDAAAQLAFRRATQTDYDGWLDHVRAAAGCTRPIRLVGDLYTVTRTGPATATVLDHRHTDQLPDRAIYKACGNRRATVCPSCAATYQGDAYQLLRAGLIGGKGVPTTVSQHPAIFPTLTAPSFGLVHTCNVGRHTCANRRRCDCRPDPCRARTGDHTRCPHGRPTVCWTRHDTGDPDLGRPLCLDCYDHTHHVVWNLFSAQLWHRTKQAAARYLAHLATRRGIPKVAVRTAAGTWVNKPPVGLAHGKAAEMQRRAAVHFHALLRLDGTHPTDPRAVVPPPAGFTTHDVQHAIEYAARHTEFNTPPHPDRPQGWLIGWGEQLVTKHVILTSADHVDDASHISDQAVAGYLAKYATKSTEITSHTSTRITADNVADYADPNGDHIARLIHACWRLGRPTYTLQSQQACPDCGATRRLDCPQCTTPDTEPDQSHDRSANSYAGLRRWAHMLGFGGHFLTKARRYSVTFTLLRTTRIQYRRAEPTGPTETIRTADHTAEETTLIVGVLTYAGTGWHTTGDALLANTSADLARARREAGREELAHETGTTRRAGTLPAAA